MKVLCYVMFLLSINLVAFSQGNRLLVYTEGDPFLRLKIETYLENLTDTVGTEARSTLTEVESLNRLLNTNRVQIAIRDAVTAFDPNKALTLRNQDEEFLLEIANSINNFDLFLSIRVNPLVDLIEYQIELYSYYKTAQIQSGDLAYFKLLSPDLQGTANFFIDPKEEDYLIKLNNGVRSLFRSASVLPEPLISINGNEFRGGAFRIGLNDSLLLDASQSKYLNNDFSNLKFEWTLLEFNGTKPSEIQDLGIRENSTIQWIVFPQLGTYKIGLRIWDGIAFSKEQFTSVEVVENPILYVRRKSYFFVKQGRFTDILSSKRLTKVYRSKVSASNFVASSSGNDTLQYSSVRNYKSERERLEKAVRGRRAREDRATIDSSVLKLKKIASLGEGVFKHEFELRFEEPGAYWATVHDESEHVKSKIDTINFNYLYRTPVEIEVFGDRTPIIFDHTGEQLTSSLFIGIKYYFIKYVSFDMSIPVTHSQKEQTDFNSELARAGLSLRFSNTFFNLFRGLSDDPSVDGYFGIYRTNSSYKNFILTTGMKIAPHKKLLYNNMHMEYFLGYTLNLGDVFKPFGIQFGISLTPLLFR